ncbi:MAG: lipocalin family protein [Bacteroidales bacterium]|nr:lipocalin family protein [Bacteroidales bacterium]
MKKRHYLTFLCLIMALFCALTTSCNKDDNDDVNVDVNNENNQGEDKGGDNGENKGENQGENKGDDNNPSKTNELTGTWKSVYTIFTTDGVDKKVESNDNNYSLLEINEVFLRFKTIEIYENGKNNSEIGGFIIIDGDKIKTSNVTATYKAEGNTLSLSFNNNYFWNLHDVDFEKTTMTMVFKRESNTVPFRVIQEDEDILEDVVKPASLVGTWKAVLEVYPMEPGKKFEMPLTDEYELLIFSDIALTRKFITGDNYLENEYTDLYTIDGNKITFHGKTKAAKVSGNTLCLYEEEEGYIIKTVFQRQETSPEDNIEYIPISLLKGKWKAVTYEYDNSITYASDDYYSILEFTDDKIKETTYVDGEKDDETNGGYSIEGNTLSTFGSPKATIKLKGDQLTLIYNNPSYFIGTIVYHRQ